MIGMLCGMARTTANGHLKRLLEEGKLVNVGRRTQPIYHPMPGSYGVSRDAKVKRENSFSRNADEQEDSVETERTERSYLCRLDKTVFLEPVILRAVKQQVQK
ncbi:hypothetical protein SAMN05444350_13621 [Bacteroides stercorirosoris]|uniref:Uncharacterized protein n=1 Tax=Bacteroides stercorirosoris TaxID=871324 RepID=A0A1M6KCI4_9BACE|nr:hypothetical protein SAMN05444350_13621 [Bacteroides stercorirosoris]